MHFGMHLRELWEQKAGVAIAFTVALLAAARMIYGFSLLPPALEAKQLQLGSASTRVVVDTPRSVVTDLREDTYSIEGLSNRALLLGNVMASLPVRRFIAHRAGISAEQIRATPPVTPDQPRTMVDAEHQPHTSDLLKRTDEYRLSIQANPTVPILDIYSEAPDGAAAEKLANAAVNGLRDYLETTASEQGTPISDQVRLEQLGSAKGGVINDGAGLRLAILVFFIVFSLASAAVLFIGRVRRGWTASASLGANTGRTT
jgi:hypothetical protein